VRFCPVTVTLAKAPVKVKKNGSLMAALEYVDGDDRLDLVVHVVTQELELSEDDTEAYLEGQTFGGDGDQGVRFG